MLWRAFIRKGTRLLERFNEYLHQLEVDLRLVRTLQSWLPYLVGAFLVALLAVSYEAAFEYVDQLLLSVKAEHSWLFLIFSPLLFWLAWWLVDRYAPTAGGSGIPQLIAALHARRDKKRFSMGYLLGGRVLVVKFVSSITALLGGAVIGREGPTIQMSASVFYTLNKLLPKSWPPLSRQRMLLAGGAAGLAAAFNTPLGGIVFAIEDLTRTHLNQFKSSLLVAVIVAGITAQSILGPYLYLGYPTVETEGMSHLGWVILFSALAGLLGGWQTKAMLEILAWKKKSLTRKKHGWYAAGAGLVLAVLIMVNPEICFGPGKQIMNNLLFDQKELANPILLFFSRMAGAILSFTSGIAGGVFATSLTTGTMLGELLTWVFGLNPDHKLYLLVCMIGFLSGVTRSPFTSAILVLEMTDRHGAIFPFMLAGLVATLSGRLVERRSMYRGLLQHYLLREENPTEEKRKDRPSEINSSEGGKGTEI